MNSLDILLKILKKSPPSIKYTRNTCTQVNGHILKFLVIQPLNIFARSTLIRKVIDRHVSPTMEYFSTSLQKFRMYKA